jgi:hypothetical protein
MDAKLAQVSDGALIIYVYPSILQESIDKDPLGGPN